MPSQLNNYKVVESERGGRETGSGKIIWGFRIAGFGFFREQVGSIP